MFKTDCSKSFQGSPQKCIVHLHALAWGKQQALFLVQKTKDSRTKEVMLSLYQSRLSQHNTES